MLPHLLIKREVLN